MKRKFCSILLALCMVLTLLPTTALAAGKYNDTEGHWAEDSINRWSDHEIIEGSDGSFAPNDSLTRGQMAVILCRLLNLPAAPSAKFTDVDEGAWYADAINRCAAAGIMLGADGKAMPGEPISREQSMVMLCRALDIAPVENPDLSKYADADRISDYAKGYVAALINAGIINGVTDDTVAPQDEINRASTVTILDRAIITYADEPGQTVEANGGIVIVAADNVTVTGNAGSVIVSSPEGKVTLDNVTTETVTVTSEGGNVTLNNSTVGSMNVNAPDTGVETKGTTTVETVSTKAENTAITTGGKSEIGTVSVGGNAAGTTVNAGSGTTIGSVENAGSGTTVTGSGKVESVSSSTDVTVETKGTEVTNSGEGKISVTDQNGKENEVTAGESTTQTPSTPSTPSGGSSGGGSSAPSHSHSWTFVSGTAANCTDTGTKDHYTCTCGAKAELVDGVYTVKNDTELELAKNPDNHKGALGSEWQKDAAQHWKVYSCCSAEGPKTNHSYDESAHKCVCGAYSSEVVAATDGVGYTTLKDAIEAAAEGGTVTLVQSVTVTEQVNLGKPITLDGDGKTITAVGTWATSSDVKFLMNIGSSNVTVENLTLDCGDTVKAWGLNIYHSTNVTLKDVKVSNVDTTVPYAGMVVNGSVVTAENLNVAKGLYGSINVDAKSHTANPTSLTVTGTLELNEGMIWVDSGNTIGTGNGQVSVAIEGYSPVYYSGSHIYTDNTSTCVAEAGGVYYTSLDTAITKVTSGGTVNLVNDVALTEALTIGKNITINGNDKKVSGYPVWCGTNTVTFKNVEFASPKDNNNKASHVYSSGSITFDKCKFNASQWDSIQLTPNADGRILRIEDCTFTAVGIDGSTTQPKRFIHVEIHEKTSNPKNQNNYKTAITITGNTFNGDAALKDDSIGLYFLAPDSTMRLGNNTFETGANPDVWICRSGSNSEIYENEAVGMLTGAILTYTVPGT